MTESAGLTAQYSLPMQLPTWAITSRRRIYASLTGLLPPQYAALVDLRRPAYWLGWGGGPLNGQARRREIVRELGRAIQFDGAIETGTFRGSSTEFLAAIFGRVWTVEDNERAFTFSSKRFSMNPEVTVELGDSRTFLDRLLHDLQMDGKTLFIYLDAHWKNDLPLADELGVIAAAPIHCVVMVDDFQVPHDSGYGYDDYGPGRALVEASLPVSLLKGWALMYPAARSISETGTRRGCCILASPALVERARSDTLSFARVL
jgi:hypothetical protein